MQLSFPPFTSTQNLSPMPPAFPRIWHLHCFLGAPTSFQPQALCTCCWTCAFQSHLLWPAGPCFFFFFFFAAPISKSLSSFLKYSYSARTDLIICSFIHSFIPSLLLPSGSHVGALELMETIQPQATGEPGLALCVLL